MHNSPPFTLTGIGNRLPLVDDMDPALDLYQMGAGATAASRLPAQGMVRPASGSARSPVPWGRDS